MYFTPTSFFTGFAAVPLRKKKIAWEARMLSHEPITNTTVLSQLLNIYDPITVLRT
jgi:hypothetical protein